MTTTPSQRAQLAYETWRDTPADGESQWPKWLAVEAALRLPAGEGWQPIETAPLNLDDVQLWDGGDVMVGYYAHGRWYGRAGSTGELGVVHPTHWKPQTAAPRHEPGEG